jgi:DNA (cytosine-5)-methyltransferase 1
VRPVLLDLFCGAGGCAVGYHRAGFDVVGVDLHPQPNYPFEFVRADAMNYVHRGRVDAVHASPPCQGYMNLTRVNESLGRDPQHADLIRPVRAALQATGLPYVIENVADAGPHLIDPIRLCGTSFGLPLRRHRLFESNVPLMAPACAHHLFIEPRYWTGWRPNGVHRLSTVVQVYGNAADKHEWPAAMGIDWMTYDELAEAVPPAFTEHVGGYLMEAVRRSPARAVHSA